MAIYMKIDGVDGNVTTKGYEKCIEVYGMQWNASREVSNTTGKDADRGKAIPYISEVVVNKQMDETSPNIFLETCKGQAKKNVKISHVKGGDKPEAFLEYTLNDVLISSYSVAGDSDGVPHESLALNFTKIEMKFIGYDKTTKQSKPIPAVYDLAQVSNG